MARVGFENVRGYLKGGFGAWQAAQKPVDTIDGIDANEFASRVNKGSGKILDVRKDSEAELGHVRGASVIALQELEKKWSRLNPEEPLIIHCAGGYRSAIAGSLLKAKGFKHITHVHGGWNKIKNTNIPIEKGVPVNA
jgi:rhodanese-related sulfurtransferase